MEKMDCFYRNFHIRRFAFGRERLFSKNYNPFKLGASDRSSAFWAPEAADSAC